MHRHIMAAAAAVSLVGFTSLVRADSYASLFTTGGGTTSFYLNEAANSAFLVTGSGSTSLSTSRGKTGFATPTGSYSVVVNELGGTGYLVHDGGTLTLSNGSMTTDTPPVPVPGSTVTYNTVGSLLIDSYLNNSFLAIGTPRGVTVNEDPSSPNFGRFYIASGSGSTDTHQLRTTTKGVYFLNPDASDAYGYGDTGQTAGLPFGASTSSPYRIEVGQDGNLYLGDNSTVSGTVYEMSPNGQAGTLVFSGQGSGVELTNGHGNVYSSPLVFGSLANGGSLTVYTTDANYAGASGSGTNLFNSILKYNVTALNGVGSPTLVSNLSPTNAINYVPNITTDIAAANSKLYWTEYRSAGVDSGLVVVDQNSGSVLFDSLAASRTLAGSTAQIDSIFKSQAVAVSPDGKTLACLNVDNQIIVVPLIDGIPDLANKSIIPTDDLSENGRDIAFDAAGNIYTSSSGQTGIRIYSPGGPSQTTYNSNGTFSVRNRPEWDSTGSGSISANANWLLGYVPNGTDQTAVFGSKITAASTVSVNAPFTVGSLWFNSANSYTLAGSSTLTLASYGEPRVQTFAGSHTVSAPVLATNNLLVTTEPGSSVTMSNFAIAGGSAGSLTISKADAGTLTLNNYRAGTLTIYGGTAKVLANATANFAAATSKVTALNFPTSIIGGVGTFTNTGKLDLTNNSLVVDYTGTTSFGAVQAAITSGYNGGAWTGPGIVSSSAPLTSGVGKTALGYAEASSLSGILSTGVFAGQTIDSTSVLVKYTYSGDTNLDGSVSIADLGNLATNYGLNSGATWTQGDFNYDGKVNIADLGLLATNYGQGNSTPLDIAAFENELKVLGLPQVAVPEPTTLGLLSLGGLMAVRRRRRA